MESLLVLTGALSGKPPAHGCPAPRNYASGPDGETHALHADDLAAAASPAVAATSPAGGAATPPAAAAA